MRDNISNLRNQKKMLRRAEEEENEFAPPNQN